MRDPRAVARELGGDPEPAPATVSALEHATAAANALALLEARPIEATPDLIAYAQAQSSLAIALLLADIRTQLEKP